jgi:hypothetical protein
MSIGPIKEVIAAYRRLIDPTAQEATPQMAAVG